VFSVGDGQFRAGREWGSHSHVWVYMTVSIRMQVIEIGVVLCCDKCIRKIRGKLEEMPGECPNLFSEDIVRFCVMRPFPNPFICHNEAFQQNLCSNCLFGFLQR